MGAFGALGEAAGSYAQAAQLDQQRQFLDEQEKRKQFVDHLSKLAFDETAHPESRNAAWQLMVEGVHTPWNKVWKPDFNRLVAPAQPPQQMASFQPPAPPPDAQVSQQTGQPPVPVPQGVESMLRTGGQSPVALMSPPQPPGIFKSPEEITRIGAERKGALTRAEAGAEAKIPITQVNPETGALEQSFASGTGERIGQTFENVWNPMILRMQAMGMHPIVYVGSQGEPLPGFQNKFSGAITDQNGEVVPNAQVFNAAILPRTGTESMNPKGEVKRQTTRTLKPPVAGGAAQAPQQQQLQAPAPPPSDVTMGAAQAAGAPTGQAGPAPATAQPAAGKAKEPKSTAHITKGAVDFSTADDPVSLAAIDWATKGRTPKNTMAERQVRTRMKQMGLEPAMPVPPALQKTIQESFVARNSAIGLIDDIMKNSRVLDSLISAGKIQVAANPKTGAGIMTRAANLTAQEAKVAGDFGQLVEHANLLRGPLGATGFRGEQAWEALQAQRGNIMSDPRITRQMLTGMRERLVGLNNADKMVLGGQGMSGEQATLKTSGHKEGDVVNVKGQRVKITKIHDDGTFDGEPAGK